MLLNCRGLTCQAVSSVSFFRFQFLKLTVVVADEYTVTVFIFRTNISLLHHWLKSKHSVKLVSPAAWLSTCNENYVVHFHANLNTLDARITESALYQDRQHCRK